ncbi:MAG TPA: hypothetical protein VIC55_06935 [Gemmatimonadaceae bacterium]|jgi:hypothetical protein
MISFHVADFLGARGGRALIACALGVVSALSVAAQTGDRPAGTIVASNMNDNTATLLDAATGRVLATLPTGLGSRSRAMGPRPGLAAIATAWSSSWTCVRDRQSTLCGDSACRIAWPA